MMETAAATGPANAKRYVHPPLVRKLAIFGAVFSTANCILVLVLPLIDFGADHWLVVGSFAIVCAASVYLSLAALRRCGDSIMATDDGLSAESPNRPTIFIGWNEIGQVETQNVMQRIVVTDTTGTRRISAEYHLQDFGELRQRIFEKSGRA